jgi:hypothetical protein
MRPQYPNVAKVELVAQALGNLRERLVFVGGCAVDLLLTDTAAAPSRVTYDVDLMPTDTNILGFANRWYPLVVETAQQVVLPSGVTINLVVAPVFLATKFEAFADRGKGDLLGSHDLEDIINVLDGRHEIVGEIGLSLMELRRYLAYQCSALLALPNFMDALQGMVFPDESLAERMQILAERIRQIAQFDEKRCIE